MHGPVRVEGEVKAGTATVTLSFAEWKEAEVAPTTHTLKVLSKPGPKEEPIAPNLFASLIHSERRVRLSRAEFSSDGKQLLTAGYPSGVVQIWDVATKTEVRQIDAGRNNRGAALSSLMAPDWKTLYIPSAVRSVKRVEREGKIVHRVEYTGHVHVWDVASGKEQEPLRSPADWAPIGAWLAPQGRLLVAIEWASSDFSDEGKKAVTVVWDLATRKKWKLSDGHSVPLFLPDGKTVAVVLDGASGKPVLKLLDLSSGKELARLDWPEKERYTYGASVSPNGTLIALRIGRQNGGSREVWFLDARTLEVRCKFTGEGDARGLMWGFGLFTPDGKRFVASDGLNHVMLWDLAGRKVTRKVPIGTSEMMLKLSPDGKTLAVAWAPKEAPDTGRTLDSRERPQPRVTLIDLTRNTPARVLIAPHGYLGALTFSPDSKTLALGGDGAVHLFDLTK